MLDVRFKKIRRETYLFNPHINNLKLSSIALKKAIAL